MQLSDIIRVSWDSQRIGQGTRVKVTSKKGPAKQYAIIMHDHNDGKGKSFDLSRDATGIRVMNGTERCTIIDRHNDDQVVCTGKVIAEMRSGRQHIELVTDKETVEAATD